MDARIERRAGISKRVSAASSRNEMTGQLSLVFMLFSLGAGALSSLFFVWQWTFGGPPQWIGWILLFGTITAAAMVFRYLNQRMPRRSGRVGGYWLMLGVVVAFAAYWIADHARARPDGGWDAWMIWNLHARFLYRGEPSGWQALFDPALSWSNNDYPLLLPALVRAFWTITGAEQPVIPALISVAYSLLAVGIVCCSLSALSGDQRGALAGLILLATPTFDSFSSLQMADIPIAVYVLIGGVLLRFADVWPVVRPSLLALSGFSMGLAAWTKHEGAVAVVALLIAHAVGSWRTGWGNYVKGVAAIAVGLAPMLVLLIAFKMFLAPQGAIRMDSTSLAHLVELHRYTTVLRGFLYELITFGAPGLNPFMLVLLYLALYRSPLEPQNVSSFTLVLIPACMVVSYFFVYLITPYDVDWHISNSLNRLLIQVWPITIFAFCVSPLHRRVSGSPQAAHRARLGGSALGSTVREVSA
jgi:hypothetical protein